MMIMMRQQQQTFVLLLLCFISSLAALPPLPIVILPLLPRSAQAVNSDSLWLFSHTLEAPPSALGVAWDFLAPLDRYYCGNETTAAPPRLLRRRPQSAPPPDASSAARAR